jgi:phage terminase large subunit-like protein
VRRWHGAIRHLNPHIGIRQGHLIAVPGPVIQFNFVAAEVAKLAVKFKITNLAYDLYRAEEFTEFLANQGCHIPLLPFGQGYKSMGPACTHFAEMALLGKIHHGNHPVLKACVLDSVMVQDDADNLKFSKSKSTGIRIDGVVALTMALGAPRPKPRDFKMMFI